MEKTGNDLKFHFLNNLKDSIFISKYDLEGNYINTDKLQNELSLCSYNKNIFYIGKNKYKDCLINLNDFENKENFIYSLFFKNSENIIKKIPIFILKENEDFQNFDINDIKNKNYNSYYFLYENLLGKNENNKIIKISSESVFRVFREENKYLPILIIKYKNINLLKEKNILEPIKIKFKIQYKENSEKIFKNILILFIITNIIIFFLWIINNIIFGKNNPENPLQNNYTFYKIGNWIYILLKIWAIVIFFF